MLHYVLLSCNIWVEIARTIKKEVYMTLEQVITLIESEEQLLREARYNAYQRKDEEEYKKLTYQMDEDDKIIAILKIINSGKSSK